jgi:hypothetical protein
VEEMNVEVERNIGGKWWTMKFLGQSDSNVDHLSRKGYVVHEYIHVATDFVRNGRKAERDGSDPHFTLRGYRLTYQRPSKVGCNLKMLRGKSE